MSQRIEDINTGELHRIYDELTYKLEGINGDLRSRTLSRVDESDLLSERDTIESTLDAIDKELDYRERGSNRDQGRRSGGSLADLYRGSNNTSSYGSVGRTTKYSKKSSSSQGGGIDARHEPRDREDRSHRGTINDAPIDEYMDKSDPVDEVKRNTASKGPRVADSLIYTKDSLYPYLTCEKVNEVLERSGNKAKRVLKGLDITPNIPRVVSIDGDAWLTNIQDNPNEIRYALRKVNYYIGKVGEGDEDETLDPTMSGYNRIKDSLPSDSKTIKWGEDAVVHSINRLAIMLLVNKKLNSIEDYAKYIEDLSEVKTEILNNFVRAVKALKINIAKDGTVRVYREVPTILGCVALEEALNDLETFITIEGQYKAFQISRDSFPSVMIPLMAVAGEFSSSVMSLVTTTGKKYNIFIVEDKAVIERDHSICS